MPVPFQELSPSPILRITRQGEGSSGTRIFLIDWANYPEFIGEVLGNATVVNGSAVLLNPPSSFPGSPILIADSAQVETFDEKPQNVTVTLSTAHSVYGYAKVTVQYAPLPVGTQANNPPNTPPVPGGTYLDYTSDAAGEYVTLPGEQVLWEDNGDALSSEITAGVLLGSESLELNWSRVAYPPWSAIQAAKGKVNNAAFCGYPAGHVLFLGARKRRSFQIDDKALWTLGMMFKARSQPWNYAYRADPGRPADGGFVGWQAYTDSSGEHIYEETDFSALFQYS